MLTIDVYSQAQPTRCRKTYERFNAQFSEQGQLFCSSDAAEERWYIAIRHLLMQ